MTSQTPNTRLCEHCGLVLDSSDTCTACRDNFLFEDRHLPSSKTSLHVDISGAEIIADDNPDQETSDIYLPKHTEFISHIALDIGGSLAKVVYFTRQPSSKRWHRGKRRSTVEEPEPENDSSAKPRPNGILNPNSLSARSSISEVATSPSRMRARRSSTVNSTSLPGGRLNFTKFETGDIDSCIEFISTLIESSSRSHGVSLEEMKQRVKIMATGGGAHLYYERLTQELGVEVRKEEEMDCLITGMTFITEIPYEVFWYSDELVQAISHRPTIIRPQDGKMGSLKEQVVTPPDGELPRPSADPPQYSILFDAEPTPQFPCLLVNIGSGVSIIKVDDYGKYERISGTSLGGGTLWGLLSLLTGADSFDEMLRLSESGDNSTVDMLVGDIYGTDYSKIGLKSSTIASSFGKVFRKGQRAKAHRPEDICKSLLYAISNNIGQIAYMNAEKHNLDRIYFGGCFIRGHAATISTLSYAIRFWSKGTKKALFLRHEGYLGSIGAWLKNIEQETVPGTPAGESNIQLSPLTAPSA